MLLWKHCSFLSIGGEPIWNVYRSEYEPMTMDHQWTRSIVIGSFLNDVLLLIEIKFQIGSPPNENGAEIFSKTVHRVNGCFVTPLNSTVLRYINLRTTYITLQVTDDLISASPKATLLNSTLYRLLIEFEEKNTPSSNYVLRRARFSVGQGRSDQKNVRSVLEWLLLEQYMPVTAGTKRQRGGKCRCQKIT